MPMPLPAGVSYITLTNQWELAHNTSATCSYLLGNLTAWSSTQLKRIQMFVIDW